jgi:membrane protease YdiL (CAAX protease family)
MLAILTGFIDLILAGYIIHRVLYANRTYHQLKIAIEQGDTNARSRYYQRILVFEFISATLALFALQFDFSKLRPGYLALTHISILPSAVQNGDFADGFAHGMAFAHSNILPSALQDGDLSAGFFHGIVSGLVGGLIFATAAAILIRIWKNRRPQGEQKKHWWHRLLPDFSALLPAGLRERLLFSAVAISAGVCEEVVFRGWLLYTLHNDLALNGTTLVLAAAACFGLAHFYQGAIGVIVTTIVAILFTFLYVQSGSLLLPSLLHILIDLRWVLLPARRSVDLPMLATENAGSVA